MGTSERKERERLSRYNSILDAAEEVFFEKGLHQTTVEEIAKKAELSKGTIYLYFKCKELIYIGINNRASSVLRQLFERVLKMKKSGMDRMIEIGKAYYKFSQKYPYYFRLMTFVDHMSAEILGKIKDDPIVVEAHDNGQAVLGVIAEILRQGMADGTVRKDIDPLKTAVQTWAQSNGVITMEKNMKCHYKTRDLGFDNLYPDYLVMMRNSLKAEN